MWQGLCAVMQYFTGRVLASYAKVQCHTKLLAHASPHNVLPQVWALLTLFAPLHPLSIAWVLVCSFLNFMFTQEQTGLTMKVSQVTAVVLVIFCNSRVKGAKQTQLIAKSDWKIT